MENIAAFIAISSLVVVCILTLWVIRRRDASEVRDPGEALVEFGIAYPDEAVRAVLMDKHGTTTFMRLADGKTGLTEVLGNTFVVRLIQPGDVQVDISPDGEGLLILFEDDSMIGGHYEFASAEDAAEVSMWICGSFGLKMSQGN